MYCADEVNDLVIKAQNDIIYHGGLYDSWDDRITNAIIQCSALGKEEDRDDLVLKVRYQLKNVGLEAARPRVVSLKELETRKVSDPGPYDDSIMW